MPTAIIFPPTPTPGQVFQLWTFDGEKWVCTGGAGPPSPGIEAMPTNMIAFTNSGTYTPSANLVSVIVECWGGGGAGGFGDGSINGWGGGGGGGSGTYSRSVLSAATIGASQQVTIGAGGAATATSSGDGAATSFGTLVIAPGGHAGAASDLAAEAGTGGAGGDVGTGGISISGGAGGYGSFGPSDASTPPNFPVWGGSGGGPGGASGPALFGQTISQAGQNALPNTGGGGSGGITVAANLVAAPSVPGGTGGSGLCVVTEFTHT